MRRIYGLIVMVIALTSICGHLAGITVMYHWGSSTAGMGINTALCLFLVALWQLTEGRS
jgi:hypothetical protein